MMKGLLLKDFYTAGNYKRSFFLLAAMVVIFIFAGMTTGSYIFLVLILMSTTIVNGNFSYDESARWDRFACALPLKRSTIVAARYLFALLFMLALVLAGGLLLVIAAVVRGQTETLPVSLVGILAASLFSLFSMSITLPASYKLGPEKARIINIISYAVLFGAYALVIFLLPKDFDPASLPAMVTPHTSHHRPVCLRRAQHWHLYRLLLPLPPLLRKTGFLAATLLEQFPPEWAVYRNIQSRLPLGNLDCAYTAKCGIVKFT